jgi:DNA primase
MPLIKQASIEAVLAAVDMLEVVSPYTTIKKSGTTYLGRCPFHGEKTPSFSVDPARKLYYCFGCGEGGNVFRFVQEKEGLQFADAVRQLADKYGVRLEFEQDSPGAEKKRLERDRLLALLDDAAKYYSRVLAESGSAAPARKYLKKRGFTDETIAAFRLGFSPVKGDALLKAASSKGYSQAELVRAGLIQDGRGGKIDRFRGRLMFPFTDHRGRVLGFGARVLDDSKPKYLNSPETELYHKSNLVFGLANARQAITREDRAYVVEGYTDVLALYQVGIAGSVASMGTALTEPQLREISRFSHNIFLAFDADAAGESAMLRALALTKKLNLAVRVLTIPPGKDPADIALSDGGADRFRKLGDASQGLLQYQLRSALRRFDLESAEGRIDAYKSVAPILAGAASSVERDEQMRMVADRLRLSPENMAYLMKSASLPENEQYGERAARRVLSQDEIIERTFLSLCLAREKEAGRYLRLMTEAYFTSAANRAAFHWVKEKVQSGDSAGDGATVPPDGELSLILPELMIRAHTDSSAPEALPELFMKLCEAELNRRIGDLRHQLDSGNEVDLQELYRLEHSRREILRKIHSGVYEDA